MSIRLIALYTLLMFAATSQAFTITFEEGLNHILGSGPVPIDDYFDGKFRVHFDGATYIEVPINTSGIPPGPPLASSGLVSISSILLPVPPDRYKWTTITASFSAQASFVSIWVLAIDARIIPTMTAFDEAGNVLGTSVYHPPEGQTDFNITNTSTLEITAVGIRSIAFDGGFDTASAIYDDLTITPQIASVPLPTTIRLFGSAIGGLGMMRRRFA